MLAVVEGLAVRGRDLPGGRALCLAEHLLLDLEVGPRVVVVELGERVGSMAGGRRALLPSSPATPATRPRRRKLRRGAARALRRELGPERLVLLRERIVPPGERFHLRRRQGELLPVGENGCDGRTGKVRGGRNDRRFGGRSRRRRRGAAHREDAEERRRAHAWPEHPERFRGCVPRRARSRDGRGALSMTRALRIVAGCVLLASLVPTPARA